MHSPIRMFDFNRSHYHREIKGYLYSARRMALDYIADSVIDKYPVKTRNTSNIKAVLPHNTSKISRRRARRTLRNTDVNFQPPTQRTIVVSINSSMRVHPSIPHLVGVFIHSRESVLNSFVHLEAAKSYCKKGSSCSCRRVQYFPNVQ